MFVYFTFFVRDSVMCNLPDTMNSNNFPPDFCKKEYFIQAESETAPQANYDSNWNLLVYKKAYH